MKCLSEAELLISVVWVSVLYCGSARDAVAIIMQVHPLLGKVASRFTQVRALC